MTDPERIALVRAALEAAAEAVRKTGLPYYEEYKATPPTHSRKRERAFRDAHILAHAHEAVLAIDAAVIVAKEADQ